MTVLDFTAKLEKACSDDATLIGLGFRIRRSEYVNMNPDLTPWLGIYSASETYTPRTLGVSTVSQRGTQDVRLVVQASHLKSGSKCEDRLREYIDAVLAVLFRRLERYAVQNVSVEWRYQETESDSIAFQWAIMTVRGEWATG